MSYRLLSDSERTASSARERIAEHWLATEPPLVRRLVALAQLDEPERTRVEARAAEWIRCVRMQTQGPSPVDAFMREYDLSTDEGVLLMCIAEALLRIPDSDTAEKLIEDKLGHGVWQRHLGHSNSLLVNASTWSLMLSGRLLRVAQSTPLDAFGSLRALAARAGEPVVRIALRHAMQLMAQHFVMGRTIESAIERAGRGNSPEAYSYDMLGEAAMTARDAEAYFQRYLHAIHCLGRVKPSAEGEAAIRPGISIKLSALHPRYEYRQAKRVRLELLPKLRSLATASREANIGLTVDAEESERLELSLDLFDRVLADPALDGWHGFGLAVQAFSRRALPLIDWLHERATQLDRKIPVRLVKGAYWDREIKQAQVDGLPDYPVFTRKTHSDVSFLACARRLLNARDRFYPMLATHNAHSLSAILALAGDTQGYELQRLHGMGEDLHRIVTNETGLCSRIYAPVGAHAELLPYLVRRLLENGANTSFVNRLFDEQLPPEALARDPVADVGTAQPGVAGPEALFAPERRNSPGLLLPSFRTRGELEQQLIEASLESSAAERKLKSKPATDQIYVSNPANRAQRIGWCSVSSPDALYEAVAEACDAQPEWSRVAVDERAAVLERAADALWNDRAAFLHLLVSEAGKTLPASLSELREAIDFLRYYASQARRQLITQDLPGTTGESNRLGVHGRGVWACISPWNFPLAIFTGQLAAALVTGNAVIAKPAEQTPLVAQRMTGLMHRSGCPQRVLHCLVGDGELGDALVTRRAIAGVAFTGSLAVAKQIQRRLAERDGAIIPLIAETGGQNVMIADSSALTEQVVRDALDSAFGSAGQRCSALRLLYLQEECFESTLSMLHDAMRELVIGDPAQLSTDIGPVIDDSARERLESCVDGLRQKGQIIEQLALPAACVRGSFVAPVLARVDGIEALGEEQFGPILHVASYPARELEAIVARINAIGYGLTLGVHSRIETTWEQVVTQARIGNLYVNRGMTGAIVGSQPFGGEGLSGTGPKAGGPNYLMRFVTERSVCINTSAMGGDPDLLGQRDP